ncbi:MAG TPA: rhomboid family intramembrane serine protease [Steroidobacteraceae bacterium]|nr:rhomboid family intramembrane serine protease [Steroidobacteraceae bacterium]
MVDGDMDYSGYSTSELQEALAGIDRGKFPRNYEKLVETLRARDASSAATSLFHDDAARASPAVFDVKYTLTPLVGAPDNDFGLAGRGRIEFSGSLVHLSGKDTNLWWRRPLAVAFPLGAVAAAARSGSSFRIEFAPAGESPVQAAFRTRDADADALARLLPSPAAAPAPVPRGIVAEFEQRLAAVGPRTPVTFCLIAANAAVFAAMAFDGAGIMVPEPAAHVRWGSNVVPLTVDGEWWRLGTAMFLHFGLMHLLVNMWVLYAQGRLAERLFGSARFLALYLLSGLAGGVTSVWWNPAVNSAGASGAIFGVLGGLLAIMLARRHGVPLPVMKTHRASLLVFVFYSLVYGASREGIDNAAHLGGLVAGAALGFMLARPVHPAAREQAAPLRVSGTVLAAVLLLGLATLGTVRTRDRLGATEQFEATLVWFVHREPEAVDAYNALVERAHAGDLADADFAAAVSSEVVPLYADASRRFDSAVAAMSSPGDRETRLREYAQLKHRSFVALDESLRTRNLQGVEEAMRSMRAADALLNGLGGGNGKAPSPD